MLIQFEEYLTFENIYLWVNFAILPFWLLLIIIPNSKITQFFVNSVILPLILGVVYAYIIYQAFLLDDPVSDIFKLYLNLDSLYTIFATESFLVVFLKALLDPFVPRNSKKNQRFLHQELDILVTLRYLLYGLMVHL